MGVFNFATGTARVELTSADVISSLQTVNDMQIPIYDLQITGDLTASFTVAQGSLKRIQKAAERKGDRIKVLSQKGIYNRISRLRQRKILLIGITVLFGLTLFLPSRVLFVDVEGNEYVPSNMIKEAAQEAGIRFFASRRTVRSEKMKNELLGKLPQLQWAGINTYGCTAVISVRERKTEDILREEVSINNIVAACDGVITSCTVTAGTGICEVGQAVRKGQVLVSGYTDCGGVIMARGAEGEIFAQTRHNIYAVTPARVKNRTQLKEDRTKYYLLFGKKCIKLSKGSGISDSSCVKMVSQYTLTLPGGYVLPFAFVKERYAAYELQDNCADGSSLASQLSVFSKALLRSRTVALMITDAREELNSGDDLIILNGTYNCTEMIGRKQGEQIGDFYGKTD